MRSVSIIGSLIVFITLIINFIIGIGGNMDNQLVNKTNSSQDSTSYGITGTIKLKDVKYWAYQINGYYSKKDIESIANSKYDMVVLEPTKTCKDGLDFDTAGMVRRIKNSKASDGKSGKLILAYINIGEAENWRWYWDKISSAKNPEHNIIISPDPDGWKGNYLAAFWEDKWKDIIIYGSDTAKGLPYKSAIDEAISDGFDGIYLDWIEAYEETRVTQAAKKAGVDPKKEMIKFLSQIRAYTKQRIDDFIIIQQNASSIVDERDEAYDYIDAIAQEGVWYDGTAYDEWDDPSACDIPNDTDLTLEYIINLSRYIKKGKPVFNVEYAEKNAEEVYELSRKNGYIPYCSRRALSKLSNTPPYR